MENQQQRDDSNRQGKNWKQILTGGTKSKAQSYKSTTTFLR
jgi:hypothetical protein